MGNFATGYFEHLTLQNSSGQLLIKLETIKTRNNEIL